MPLPAIATRASIIVTTGTTGQKFEVDSGAKADLQFTPAGVISISDPPLDPRDFGCPWNGVDDDLPGLKAMIDNIPVTRTRVTRIQLPKGAGYCSDNWEISKPVEIIGHGKDYVSTGNQIKFAPLRGIIFHGYFSSPNYIANASTGSAGNSTIRGVNVISTQAVVSDDVGNWGLASGFQLGTAASIWETLPANVPLGSCVLRSNAGAAVSVGSSTLEYYGDGYTRNTTHLVMFRCTTAGKRGSAVPGAFETAGLAQLGTTIAATDGTAVWTVESVPKDYVNNTSYVVGQRVFIPGDNDHVFECIAAGTSVALASTTITAASNGVALPPPTGNIDVLDTSSFPATGTICVVTSNGRQFVKYTGKNATQFTGCASVSELKAASGTMSTGEAVTGPYPYIQWGIPVWCAPDFLTPAHRGDFYDLSTSLAGILEPAELPLPQSTLNVPSTEMFAATGTLQVWNGAAYTTVTYTGKTATSFTGCTGGSGTIHNDYNVGQGTLRWKEIASGNIVLLGQFLSVEDCFIAGATGPAVWIGMYFSKGQLSGGTNFWAVRRCSIAYCGGGLTLNGNNLNGGESCFLQYDFIGAGRTNVDGPAYLNFIATVNTATWKNGKFGNGCAAIKDRNQGTVAHRSHYIQFSGGMPYRNDLFGSSGPLGNSGVWEDLYDEVVLRPIFYSPALIGTVAGVHAASTATVLSGTANRYINVVTPFVSDASQSVYARFGSSDGLAAGPFIFQVVNDSYWVGYGVSEDINLYPAKWFTFGKAGPVFFTEQLFAFPRPFPAGTTWPSGAAVGQAMPMWITQDRVWIGLLPNMDPSSIGFEAAQPASGYYVQGSLVFQKNAAAGRALGWVCLSTGTPGTWQELDNVFATTSLPMNLLLRGSYSASPWAGVASAGGFSSAKNASEATNPPSVGATVNGIAPASFDGTNDTLTLTGTLADYVSASAYSGWAWVFANSVATDNVDGFNNHVIISNSTAAAFAIGMRSSGKVTLYHLDTAGKNAEAPFTIGAWQFVHWRFDGRKICIGVDGTWGTPVAATNLASLANGVKLGKAQPGFFSNMKLLEVALTDIALTNSDFERVYKAGKSRYAL